jgi:hypothetical protein
MYEYLTFKLIDGSANQVREKTSHKPQIGRILDFDLNTLMEDVQGADEEGIEVGRVLV